MTECGVGRNELKIINSFYESIKNSKDWSRTQWKNFLHPHSHPDQVIDFFINLN